MPVDLLRRNERGRWELYPAGDSGTLDFGQRGSQVACRGGISPMCLWCRRSLHCAKDKTWPHSRDTQELASLAVVLPLAEVYADVLAAPAEPSLRKRQDLTP
jgi:hypothetical protein